MKIKIFILALILVYSALVPSKAWAANAGSDLFGMNTQLPNINYNAPTYAGLPAAAPNANSGSCQTPKDFATLFDYVLCILVGYVVPFLFGVGVVIFIVGVLNYVRAGDDVEKRAAGRDLMWFGIIALFVMVSVWGFVGILTRSFFGKDPAFQGLPKRATSVFEQ